MADLTTETLTFVVMAVKARRMIVRLAVIPCHTMKILKFAVIGK